MGEALHPKRYRLLDFQLQPRELPARQLRRERRPLLNQPDRREQRYERGDGPSRCLGRSYAHVWLRVRVVWAKESGVRGTVGSAGAGSVLRGFVSSRRACVWHTASDVDAPGLPGGLKLSPEGVDMLPES
jgi:hypothetical protein